MQWKELKPGTVVYHRLFTHWGKGVVDRVVGVDCLESLFERGRWRAVVKFEHLDEPARLRARELRKTPNKKKIKEMVEFYAGRGLVAKDGGDKLILPKTDGDQ